MFGEQEYLRLVDLCDDGAYPVGPATVVGATSGAETVRVDIDTRRSDSAGARRSRRGLLTAAAVMAGGLVAALMAAVDQSPTPDRAPRRSGRGTSAHARVALARSLRSRSAAAGYAIAVGVLPSRHPAAARRARRLMSSLGKARGAIAAAAARATNAGRDSRASAAADAAKPDRRPAGAVDRVGVQRVRADPSRESADFTFER